MVGGAGGGGWSEGMNSFYRLGACAQHENAYRPREGVHKARPGERRCLRARRWQPDAPVQAPDRDAQPGGQLGLLRLLRRHPISLLVAPVKGESTRGGRRYRLAANFQCPHRQLQVSAGRPYLQLAGVE